ncbi:MAG: ABC transporter substrate-binding protein [Candidatus Acetothermia bacterium]
MSKKLGIAGLILVLSLLLALGVTALSAGHEELADEQVLTFATEGRDIATMDPHFATAFPEYALVEALFNGLVRFPPGESVNMEDIEPDLATDWESTKDATVWTFHLREGVNWHRDYGTVTAEDVKFSIERVMDPEVGSPWKGSFSEVEDVEAVDELTVRITLSQPDPFFLLKVVNYHGGYIVPKEAVEELGDDFGTEPVGSGPFAFEEYQPRDKVILTANENYFRGAPILEEIDYRFMPDDSSRELALRTGEIDAGDFPNIQRWAEDLKDQDLVVDLMGPGNMYHLHFNMSEEPFDNYKVRRALAYAFDRDEIVEFRGPAVSRKTYSMVPPGYFAHTSEVKKYEYDLEKAQQLLEEAGYPDGFSFEISISESDSYQPYAVQAQAMWEKIGVDMELEVVDHSSYHSLIRDDANKVVFYNASRLPLADVYLRQWLHSDSIVTKSTAVTNFSHYGEVDATGDGENDSIDELIDEAAGSTDLDHQIELYTEAQKQVAEHVPAFSYVQETSVFARDPSISLPYGEEDQEGYSHFQNMWAGYIFNENTKIVETD